ncbi:hypothetical protein CXF97_11715 [Pseudomonas sp. Choline-02u-1]|jgi:hypothetical protein|nr:hypothetical protein CXF97_11715 [Pseudomonas sp. Choline-02u-1]
MRLVPFLALSATDSIKARDSEVTAGIFTVIIPATGTAKPANGVVRRLLPGAHSWCLVGILLFLNWEAI